MIEIRKTENFAKWLDGLEERTQSKNIKTALHLAKNL